MRQKDAFREYFCLQKGVKIKKQISNKQEYATNKPAFVSEYSDAAGSGFVTWVWTQPYLLGKLLGIVFWYLDDLENWDLWGSEFAYLTLIILATLSDRRSPLNPTGFALVNHHSAPWLKVTQANTQECLELSALLIAFHYREQSLQIFFSLTENIIKWLRLLSIFSSICVSLWPQNSPPVWGNIPKVFQVVKWMVYKV